MNIVKTLDRMIAENMASQEALMSDLDKAIETSNQAVIAIREARAEVEMRK